MPNLQVEDEGNYWCKARNVHGEVNATFPVKVYGKRLSHILLNIFMLLKSSSLQIVICICVNVQNRTKLTFTLLRH